MNPPLCLALREIYWVFIDQVIIISLCPAPPIEILTRQSFVVCMSMCGFLAGERRSYLIFLLLLVLPIGME